MTETFEGKNILVVGGAGFVGSNLTREILKQEPRKLTIVDNFLSSEPINVPDDPVVRLISGSITDDRILRGLDSDLDYAWHLACLHGNQSSIFDPLNDHENNTLTSLKLFERLKDIKSLKKVVYAAAGCAVAEKTFDGAMATREDAPVSLFHDSPYSISKLVGEMYGNYYFTRHGLPFVKARFQNVYGPREISAPAAGAAPRTPSGATSRRPSSGSRCTARRCRSKTAASPHAISSSSRTWRAASSPARSRASPAKSTILDPASKPPSANLPSASTA